MCNDNKGLATVFMFSGQGSQYFHMGEELYLQHSGFRHWMDELDAYAIEKIGYSIVQRIYDPQCNKSQVFDNILYTHPAIFMLEYSLAQVLIAQGIKADYVMGASLGELTAAAIANVLSLEEAMDVVLTQAQIFQQNCEPGGMLAILHSPDCYNTMPILYENCEIAALNYATHFVVSGLNQGLDRVEVYLKANDITCLRLPVKQAFHSSYLDVVKEVFRRRLEQQVLIASSTPFISSTKAKIITSFEDDYLWQTLRYPIKIAETIQTMEASGNFLYVDVGPGGTFCNFVKYQLGAQSSSRSNSGLASRALAIMTPFARELLALERAKSVYRECLLGGCPGRQK